MGDRLKANLPTIDKFNGKLATERFEAQCGGLKSQSQSREPKSVLEKWCW
jgi:hypothetical protein